ncbi:MAG: 2-C-methyl-D-erythritol 2,4-cyclodiphosphate synthase [Alphaproteobacteria bacterium]|nr:2-C-methyl-D-erythritol 2,4-cyclodiphosphate synthase [Alphaproteobacteria bacterium]
MVRRMDYEFCSGLGFDVHSFSDEVAETIRLCGVDIPFHRKLKGHSDADVALHALTDAIYGAIGAGDIGQHFPPSNDDFKNMDSAVFLEHSLSLVRAEKGELVNADITLICEEPKIGPYRPYIKERLSSLLYLDKRRVNIKATTTEQLGFTGRKEGIAAQAVVSIAIPID